MSIVNMGSLLYKGGNEIPLKVEDMPVPSELNDLHYDIPMVVLRENNLCKTLAYLLSSL